MGIGEAVQEPGQRGSEMRPVSPSSPHWQTLCIVQCWAGTGKTSCQVRLATPPLGWAFYPGRFPSTAEATVPDLLRASQPFFCLLAAWATSALRPMPQALFPAPGLRDQARGQLPPQISQLLNRVPRQMLLIFRILTEPRLRDVEPP